MQEVGNKFFGDMMIYCRSNIASFSSVLVSSSSRVAQRKAQDLHLVFLALIKVVCTVLLLYAWSFIVCSVDLTFYLPVCTALWSTHFKCAAEMKLTPLLWKCLSLKYETFQSSMVTNYWPTGWCWADSVQWIYLSFFFLLNLADSKFVVPKTKTICQKTLKCSLELRVKK